MDLTRRFLGSNAKDGSCPFPAIDRCHPGQPGKVDSGPSALPALGQPLTPSETFCFMDSHFPNVEDSTSPRLPRRIGSWRGEGGEAYASLKSGAFLGGARCDDAVMSVVVSVLAPARRSRPVTPLSLHRAGGSPSGATPSGLAVVGILALGGPKRGEPGHDGARENPGAGAGRETRGQQPVVDLPRHRKAVVAPR